jgi:hypothetical protein
LAAGDTNLYRYVENDPTNELDPSGLKVEVLDTSANPVKYVELQRGDERYKQLLNGASDALRALEANGGQKLTPQQRALVLEEFQIRLNDQIASPDVVRYDSDNDIFTKVLYPLVTHDLTYLENRAKPYKIPARGIGTEAPPLYHTIDICDFNVHSLYANGLDPAKGTEYTLNTPQKFEGALTLWFVFRNTSQTDWKDFRLELIGPKPVYYRITGEIVGDLNTYMKFPQLWLASARLYGFGVKQFELIDTKAANLDRDTLVAAFPKPGSKGPFGVVPPKSRIYLEVVVDQANPLVKNFYFQVQASK